MLDGLADRVAAVTGAVALSQFPQFYGQYLQRLGGHLAEARRMVEQYTEAAADLGLTLDLYIMEHLESGSAVFTSTGEIIEELVERYYALEQSYRALQDASIYNRWVIFLREADWSIAAAAWEDFTPGVPTTIEGLVYALTGLLIGWGLYSLLKQAVILPFRKPVNRKNRPVSPVQKKRQLR